LHGTLFEIEVRKLEPAGALVDAALAKGATGIVGLQFYSTGVEEARRTALARAVISARLDAESMVRAAGYQLGTLLEITSSAPSGGPVKLRLEASAPQMAGTASAPTPVSPGELRVSEVVTVRWAINP
jgi:hypothetical protein